MSALLRHPGTVPSLFSDRTDGEVSSVDRLGLPRRALNGVAYGLTVLWLHRDGLFLKPGSAILGCLIAVVCSKPLLHTLMVGGAEPR